MKLICKRCDEIALKGYVDADWASDEIDRKSTTGFVFFIFGNVIMWTSKKQALVTLSTTEAEYVAASMATSEAIWLTKVLNDIQVEIRMPVPIFEDNMGCLFIAKNPETKRAKNIDVKFHFLCECIWNNKIVLKKIGSQDKITDCFTKGLGEVLYKKFVESLGLKHVGV